jgi:TRAP-type C4-dicarboxylate transport system permease small subunit
VARAVLRHFEEAVAVLLGLTLFAVVLWQVFTRYVLNDPSIWSEEAARYLYVGVVFFGTAAAVRDRSHVGIPFLMDRLPPAVRLAAALLTQALVVGFCAAIVVWGARAASQVWDLPSLALEIPMGLVLAVVPLTMALAAVRTVACMAEDVAAARRGEGPHTAAARDF